MRNNTPQQLQGDSKESRLHTPVLLEQVVSLLNPKIGETYLDLTAGYGGHASAIVSRIGNAGLTVLVDRDDNAIRELAPLQEQGARIVHQDFASAAHDFVEHGEQFDMVLVDLGVSSPQLDRAERGFSFMNDGPLDMRMDQSQTQSAHSLVNYASEDELYEIIRKYGEEYPALARRIAKSIVSNRPLESTAALASAVSTAYGSGYRKKHPATRTFQAIRIALNDELGQVERLLPLLPRLLKTGGRVAIISFHSLEDRLVKQYFADQAQSGYEAELAPLTKKPILGKHEDVHNPRARSATLRAAVKK
jgi:16S rRNA (cytosine1402-N4)-methyltransferase